MELSRTELSSLVTGAMAHRRFALTLLVAAFCLLDLLLTVSVEGVEPATVQYLADSVLGYAFFPRGLVADAEIDGKPARLFVVMTAGPGEAAAALAQYEAFLQEKQAESSRSDGVLSARDPLYKGVLVQRRDAYLVGVARLSDPADGKEMLRQLCGRFP